MKCSFEKENFSSNQEEMESQYMICKHCEWFYNCDVALNKILCDSSLEYYLRGLLSRGNPTCYQLFPEDY